MFKLEVQEQDDTGLWYIIKEFPGKKFNKVKKQFLWWTYNDLEIEELPERQVRMDAVTFAKTLQNKNVRILYCNEAIDDYAMPWYPDNWKKVIWQNGSWF